MNIAVCNEDEVKTMKLIEEHRGKVCKLLKISGCKSQEAFEDFLLESSSLTVVDQKLVLGTLNELPQSGLYDSLE